MEFYQIVLLAIIQGLTEFLPISSSAHLIIPSEVMGWEDQGLAFDVAVHVGTLLAVMVYFWKDIQNLFVAWVKSITTFKMTNDARLAWGVIIATIPAGLAGFLMDDFIQEHLRSILVIAATTIFFGILLYWSDISGPRNVELKEMTWRDTILIGLSQALALIPGTSRSGVTMTMGMACGLTRDAAARFSFLLSIPLILAAGLFKGVELAEVGADAAWNDVILGAVLSAISAYVCIHFFLKLLNRIGFLPFLIYRLALGAILIFIAFSA